MAKMTIWQYSSLDIKHKHKIYENYLVRKFKLVIWKQKKRPVLFFRSVYYNEYLIYEPFLWMSSKTFKRVNSTHSIVGKMFQVKKRGNAAYI